MKTRLPIPTYWQDFEDLCHKLWREIWNDPQAQRHGRQGQPQFGVDVFGKAMPLGHDAGVQCKDRDGRLGSELTISELNKECKKAVSFIPRLDEFIVATTAPSDEKIQKAARLLNQQRSYPFTVHVWSWDDIQEEIRFRSGLMSLYFPNQPLDPEGARQLTLSLLAPRDQITAFFARPDIAGAMARGVRDYVQPVAFELAENAFRHGKASRFSIRCDRDTMVFEDDGLDFNPITHLDPTKASPESYIGSFVFDVLRQKFAADLALQYERIDGRNRLTLRFARPLSHFSSPQQIDLHVDLSHTYSRTSAYRLAASIVIPDEVTEISLIVTGAVIHSGVSEFFIAMIGRLRGSQCMKVSMPNGEMAAAYGKWFKSEPRVEFTSRE